MPSEAPIYPTADAIARTLQPSIVGKVVLITGPSVGGLGFEAARVIAKDGAALVILAGRSQSKLDEAASAILAETPSAKLRKLIVDLGDFVSVRSAAEVVKDYSEKIDVLINNASFVTPRYVPTAGGTESTFTANHLGPFLFTNLIHSKFADDARVINISSSANALSGIGFGDLNFGDGKKYEHWVAYGQSKTANILFTTLIGKKWPGIESFAVHPGVIATNGWREISFEEQVAMGFRSLDGTWTAEALGGPRTMGEGAAGYIVAAFDPALKGQSGAYLVDAKVANEQAASHATDPEEAEKLWRLSEELVGLRAQ
ncbi:hypothetical protein RQP46_005083 [Phenoliferia psychrophenolica]